MSGLALCMPCIGWLYTGLEKTSYSMLHYFQSVHDRMIWRVNSFIKKTVLRLVLVSDVKRLSVYRLSFIFLVLVFEFQKPIIVSNLALSWWTKDASPRSAAIGRLVCDRDRPSHKMSACGEWRSDDTHTGKLTVGRLRLLNVDVYLFATL